VIIECNCCAPAAGNNGQAREGLDSIEEEGHQGGLARGAHQAAGHVAPRVSSEGGRLGHGEEGAAEGAVELVGARARLVAVVLRVAGRVGEELHGEHGVDGQKDQRRR
jgi:hypothetical protein